MLSNQARACYQTSQAGSQTLPPQPVGREPFKARLVIGLDRPVAVAPPSGCSLVKNLAQFHGLRALTFLLMVGSARAAEQPGVRSTALEVVGGPAGFELRAGAEIGIDFTNSLRFARLSAAQNLMNGTGVAAGDIDGDGRVDLFFLHREGVSAMYRNLGGGQFTNITGSAGVALTNLTATGVVMGDVNGDRHLDIVVASFGGPHAEISWGLRVWHRRVEFLGKSRCTWPNRLINYGTYCSRTSQAPPLL